MRRYAWALATLCSLSTTAAAQEAGTVTAGVFGHLSYFDRSLQFDQGQGGPGARLGVFFAPNLAAEAEGAWVPNIDALNGAEVEQIPLRARLTWQPPLGEHVSAVLGAGYVRTLYRGDFDVDDDGATALVGLRLGTGETIELRLDSYFDYMPSPANGAGDNYNWGGMLGLNFVFGGPRGPRDADRDGVTDDLDRCPNTPAGEAVDATGCPLPKDADNDGVTDDIDRCPNTSAGERVDANGCPVPQDADGDGVTDDRDRCADTPAGTDVDENGCPRDSDSDGVTDDRDRCPNTPAGTEVDANGCPVPQDADGDGVTDDRDRCPNTPAGTDVDESGCRVLFEDAQRATLVLEGVNFETGKADLTPESRAILTTVAQSLVANDTIRVEVQGHTDNTGSRALNQRLSQQRAEAVRQFLIENGVSASRLEARGYGPDQPIASNRTTEGRAQNRRVQLKKID